MQGAISGGRAAGALLIAILLIAGIALAGGGIGVRAQELPPGGTFTDDDGNVHEGFIEAIAAEGITQGCDASGTLYCPSDFVTRGQMATFLSRALDLPDATGDHFADDDGTTHEDNINKIFEAGITTGFADGTYQPDGLVRRDQMASFIARGIELIPGMSDFFTDDDGNVHEPNINAMAENEITLGCNADGTLYCPDDNVRRDQMASFLGRALGLDEIIPPPPTTTTTTTVVDAGIDVFNFGFNPDPFEIDGLAGAVIFNVSEGTHRMVGGTPTTPDTDLFDTGNLSAGESSGVLLVVSTGPQDLAYFCQIHPDTMRGTISING